MPLKPTQAEEEEEYTMIEERKAQLMVPPSGNGVPILQTAHFLKPLLAPNDQTLPQFPSFSLSSNPNILRELTKRVHFKGRPVPMKTWKTWVQNLQQTHQTLWIKVGIFDAIRASTYQIKRHNELIIGLAEKWCPETNTFIFPWGESTITLEDVNILGGFSVLGVSVLSPSQNSREFEELESNLTNACYELRRKTGNASHYGWMNCFRGKGGEIEHLALLVLWLSRFVFSTNSYSLINSNVFGIAISLVKGVKFALAPAVLASIYRDLSLLKDRIARFTASRGRDYGKDLVLWAPFQIVQLWFWERFPVLSPKPVSLMLGEPRLARWNNVKRLQTWSFLEEISENNFLWRPYALPLENWEFPKFYSENERWVCLNSEMGDEILSFAWCLRPCELVGMDCLEHYFPHRVGMQFGMDQDIPISLPRSNGDFNLASISYDLPLDGWKLYLPPREINGKVTVQYLKWWKGEAFTRHDDPKKMNELSNDLDGNIGGEDQRGSPVSSPPSPFTEMQMGKKCNEGSELMDVEGEIGKGKQISLEEAHQETQADNEAGEAPQVELVIIDDDDDEKNDRVSQFLIACF